MQDNKKQKKIYPLAPPGTVINCNKCGQGKLVEEFHKNRYLKNGRRNTCKECRAPERRELKYIEVNNAASATWRKNNRSKKYAICKIYVRKIKHETMAIYSLGLPKCSCCGELNEEFLTIDHINGGGNKHRKSLGLIGGRRFYQWLKKNGYPSGYRVLCFNCNMAFGLFNYCPHQNIEVMNA